MRRIVGELRCAIAADLLAVVLWLVRPYASARTIIAIHDLCAALGDDDVV